MTTLLHDDGNGPATHLFAIGVGAYRHLAGGSEPLEHLAGVRLAQLSSPPRSARTITDWFLRELHNPEAPLGSVELLVSPAESYEMPDGRDVDVEPATIANIKVAFDRWWDRCDGHEDNVAVFYFSGHGLMREIVALLAEDFGSSPQRPFESSVDFTMTFEGMARCKAGRQLYLVDACRQVMHSTLPLQRIDATALSIGEFRREGRREAPILYASAEDDRAYALRGRPTRLAEALVRSLSGAGSERIGGRWAVTFRQLVQTAAEIIDRENVPEAPMQRPRVEGEASELPTVLHVPTKTPSVGLTIGCLPEDALAQADLSLVSVRDAAKRYARRPAAAPWELEVEPGDYDVAARFATGGFHDRVDQLLAIPPFADHALEVS